MININNLYIISYQSGLYDSYSSSECIAIGEEKANEIFNILASGRPCDGDGECALYKAKIHDSCIVPDYDNKLNHKVYDDETETWKDDEEE